MPSPTIVGFLLSHRKVWITDLCFSYYYYYWEWMDKLKKIVWRTYKCKNCICQMLKYIIHYRDLFCCVFSVPLEINHFMVQRVLLNQILKCLSETAFTICVPRLNYLANSKYYPGISTIFNSVLYQKVHIHTSGMTKKMIYNGKITYFHN